MGYNLLNEFGDEFQFTNSGWRLLTEFACTHGFVWPPRNGGEGEGERTVSSEVAAQLADAIRRGMGASDDTVAAAQISAELTARLVTPSSSAMFSDDPIRLEPRTVAYWRQFESFARRGAFTINF